MLCRLQLVLLVLNKPHCLQCHRLCRPVFPGLLHHLHILPTLAAGTSHCLL